MRKRMPSYYYSNMVRQTQREYLKTGKTMEQRIADARGAVGEIMGTAVLAALYNVNDAEKLAQVYAVANMTGQEYANRRQPTAATAKAYMQGARRANEWLAEETKEILPRGFFLPISGRSKKSRETEIENAQRAAGADIVRFYAIAMKKALGYDCEQIAAVVGCAAEKYTRYMVMSRAEDAPTGAPELYKQDAAEVFAKLFPDCGKGETDHEPDFASVIW